MTSNKDDLTTILAKVLDELAYEIDANYEDEDIGILAHEDGTFRNFRRALGALRQRSVKVSRRVLHVERRMKKTYEEAMNEPLPPLDDES